MLIGFIGIVAILTNCTGWHNFRQSLRPYEGAKIEKMVDRFGAPDRSVELPGEPTRLAYTWRIRNQGGAHVCGVTAIADKASGEISKVSDNCPNDH